MREVGDDRVGAEDEMSGWIQWCECGRMILKSGQMKENRGTGKCDLCEAVEHAESFKDRINITPDEPEKEGA
jgi:hypothetical protein